MLAKTKTKSGRPFAIEETRYGDGVVVFSLTGELDLAVIETAKEAVEPVAGGSAMVVVDLTDLEFLDSSGVALLHRLARTHLGPDSLRLVSSRHEGVNRMLDLTEVGSVIPIVTG
jgi:anti-sigma B factor antagonist